MITLLCVTLCTCHRMFLFRHRTALSCFDDRYILHLDLTRAVNSFQSFIIFHCLVFTSENVRFAIRRYAQQTRRFAPSTPAQAGGRHRLWVGAEYACSEHARRT